MSCNLLVHDFSCYTNRILVHKFTKYKKFMFVSGAVCGLKFVQCRRAPYNLLLVPRIQSSMMILV